MQKTNQKEFRIERVIKRKDDKLCEYFSKPKSVGANVKVKLDLSNYATKGDSKTATGTDASDLAKKTDLANLKSDVDKLDIDKFKNMLNTLRNF